jgi:alpha-L-rhamnosidase
MYHLGSVFLDGGRVKESFRTRLTGTAHPVFSWSVQSGKADASQAAYRVRVGSAGDPGGLWDSGWVCQAAQSLCYAGAPLPEGVVIHLEIQVEDHEGERSEAWHGAFANARVVWHAGWIGAAADDRGRTVYLRREFNVRKTVASAALYACGIGYQRLSLNGEPLEGGTALDPAHTDYSKECQYVMYPTFGERLRPGANCLGAMLGEGWRRNGTTDLTIDYMSDGVKQQRTMPFRGAPCFTAMLRIDYADGETEWILSDGQWQWGRGARTANDIFNGEVYDANHTDIGWDSPGFMGFLPAIELPSPGGAMKPMLIPPVIEHGLHKPVAVWPVCNDAYIVDFGFNIAGVVRIRLPAGLANGQTIRILHAEELDDEGNLYTAPLRAAKATDTYIASGDGRDLAVWQPIFTYHGFRYARVDGLGCPLDPADIVSVELYTDLDNRSSFRCGDAQATRIHQACMATERSNQHGILTDCPQREERQGWMNDATVRFEETPYNFDVGLMFPKVIRDILDEQRSDGAITCTAPFVFGHQPADPVCSSFLVAGLETWMHTGNVDILAEAYEGFAGWAHCLLAHSDGLIVNYSFYGDWAGPAYACDHPEGARSAVTPGEYMSTGYSYLNCVLLAKFADVLDKRDEAAEWRAKADAIRQAMLDKWYDPEQARMASGSQGCQSFALWLGLIPEGDAPRAAQVLRDDLAGSGYRLTTGNLCSRYILDVLAKYGFVDDAWALMTRQAYPSFGYMLQQEATTIWERFELKENPGMNSHNHPMYAAADYWFYAYIVGVQPAAPGWRDILVKPHMPSGLLSAQAVVDTVMGEVSVHWAKRYGGVHLHVDVPFGATATVDFGGQTHRVGSGFHVFHAAPEDA